MNLITFTVLKQTIEEMDNEHGSECQLRQGSRNYKCYIPTQWIVIRLQEKFHIIEQIKNLCLNTPKEIDSEVKGEDDEDWHYESINSSKKEVDVSKNISHSQNAEGLSYGLTKYKINHYLRQGDALEIIEQFNNTKRFLFNNSAVTMSCEGMKEENVDEKKSDSSNKTSEPCIDTYTMSRVLTEVEQRSKLRDILFDLNQDEEQEVDKFKNIDQYVDIGASAKFDREIRKQLNMMNFKSYFDSLVSLAVKNELS